MKDNKTPVLPTVMDSSSEEIGRIRSRFNNNKEENKDREKLKELIRELGLKVTTQRIQILEILKYEKKHSTAQGLFEEVHKSYPNIGFATVYRFLRFLSKSGCITEVRVGNSPARYEWKTKEHHDHLTCIECGAVTEFESDKLEQLQVDIAQHFGYTLTDHLLEMYGICPTCRAKKS